MLIVILVCLIVFLLMLNLSYKQQIKKVSKQIEFVSGVQTNKIITTGIKFKELNELVFKVNKLLSKQKRMNLNDSLKEKELRKTIMNISHDIRTPLTSLNGYFQLLIETDDQNDRARYTSIIETKIESLTKLLDDMFTYIKTQDSSYQKTQEKIDINHLIQENLFSYYESFELNNIEPSLNFPESPLTITANKESLERVVNNLINNSLLHGINYISVKLFQKNQNINIAFENDVKNIEDIDIDNIFNRFYKTDFARTSDSSGLGLAIVKELVENMQGKITANKDNDVFMILIELPVE